MIQEIALNKIDPNPFQPRTQQDSAALEALAADIAARGLIQPPVGRWVDGRVQLACGHRRVEACRRLGWEAVPVDVREISDQELALLAWSENEARENLNPLDRARAIRRMMEEFGWTQEQAAQRLGLARSTIANILRLLDLRPEVQEALATGRISERQALALLPLSDLDWDSTSGWVHDRVQEILRGKRKASSDDLRELMKAAKNEASRPLDGDESSPPCESCPKRRDRRCFDVKCFEARRWEKQQEFLRQVSAEIGIPVGSGEERRLYSPLAERIAQGKRCPHARVVPGWLGQHGIGCILGEGCECEREARVQGEEEVRRRLEEISSRREKLAACLVVLQRESDSLFWKALLYVLSFPMQKISDLSDQEVREQVARLIAVDLTSRRHIPQIEELVEAIMTARPSE